MQRSSKDGTGKLYENLNCIKIKLHIYKTFRCFRRPGRNISVLREFFQRLFSRGIFSKIQSEAYLEHLSITTAIFPCLLVLLSLGMAGYLLVLIETLKLDIIFQK